jgi:enoyl-CoA hydratase/carnithine racemase
MNESLPQLPAPHVALIALNRPAAANRIQPDDLVELQRLLDACEADDAVHALILTGTGRYFSAGFDLRALTAAGDAAIDGPSAEGAFEAVADRLENSRLVTVAAVNGPVHGGATDLALACDFRVGARTAQLQMPAARFGLPLYADALQRYVGRLGLNHAKRLILLAEKVDAPELLAIGFLTELVDDGEVLERALAIATAAAAMPPAPLAAMKRALNAAARGEATAARHREALRSAWDAAAIAQRIGAIRSERKAPRA